MVDQPAYSDWFAPRNVPAETPLPERTQMALANKPVQPKCQDSDDLVDGEPNYDAGEVQEDSE